LPKANGINKGAHTEDYSIFKNIPAPNGSFTVKYHFLQAGTHQIIAAIKSKNNIFAALASFNVIVLSPSKGFSLPRIFDTTEKRLLRSIVHDQYKSK
jgi:hypothetical protein